MIQTMPVEAWVLGREFSPQDAPHAGTPRDRELPPVARTRPTKTQMKISGCHRSETTAKAWLRVRGYISTVRKHGDNVLDALRDAITGNPWTPPLAC